ncbi:uncharacterized protein LOC118188021 [Stegodyphus dumicola]|uniref:uncharacterized protein LOC118188021 n=1 Tax=Stegodyphus dumicola TaxID=202533 RepID=UPI0015ABA002|nr:uncharacterized protein LOC118188021 [Stegodyphus dumicola]
MQPNEEFDCESLRQAAVNYEELLTVICDVEAVINCRPLTYVSNDSEDLLPLTTPSMFLQDIKVSALTIDELVKKFWTLETVPEETVLSKSDVSCEEHFKTFHDGDNSGRYGARLPFKKSPSELGDSRELALRRFLLLENRLVRKPELYNLYKGFLDEYLHLRHMEVIPDSEPVSPILYYILHYPVFKPPSTSTKLSVVFDASSKTSSGYSLNDLLHVGPRIQPELFDILIRFRTYAVAICVDIEKMYRQIRVHQEDTNFQRKEDSKGR